MAIFSLTLSTAFFFSPLWAQWSAISERYGVTTVHPDCRYVQWCQQNDYNLSWSICTLPNGEMKGSFFRGIFSLRRFVCVCVYTTVTENQKFNHVVTCLKSERGGGWRRKKKTLPHMNWNSPTQSREKSQNECAAIFFSLTYVKTVEMMPLVIYQMVWWMSYDIFEVWLDALPQFIHNVHYKLNASFAEHIENRTNNDECIEYQRQKRKRRQERKKYTNRRIDILLT